MNVNAVLRGDSNALHIAAARGDVPLAMALARSPNLNFNARNSSGTTALMLACFSRNRSIIKFLLSYNANPNIQDDLGKTALHVICRLDDYNLAQELLACKTVDINKTDCYGATPLLVALLEANSLHMAKLLLKHGATLKQGPQRSLPLLLECVNNCSTPQDVEKVKFLILHGADIDTTDNISKKTVLHIVALTGYVALLSVLINLGARVNRRDVSKRLPRDVALMHGNFDCYQILMEEEIRIAQIIHAKMVESNRALRPGPSHR